jgi:hypothetical protein
MDSNKTIARIAGLWYLLFVVFGAFGGNTNQIDPQPPIQNDPLFTLPKK